MYNYQKQSGYDINASAAEIYGVNEIILMTICLAVFLASFFLLARKLNGRIKKADD